MINGYEFKTCGTQQKHSYWDHPNKNQNFVAESIDVCEAQMTKVKTNRKNKISGLMPNSMLG